MWRKADCHGPRLTSDSCWVLLCFSGTFKPSCDPRDFSAVLRGASGHTLRTLAQGSTCAEHSLFARSGVQAGQRAEEELGQQQVATLSRMNRRLRRPTAGRQGRRVESWVGVEGGGLPWSCLEQN